MKHKRLMQALIVIILMVMSVPITLMAAQDTRSIVPVPRDGVMVEVIDPMTQMPASSFCTGTNTVDVKLTNNTGYRQYVTVVNRDTRGIERTLYSGWLQAGVSYLSALLQKQLVLTGPAGTEMLRVDTQNYGQWMPGNWVSLTVRECGGPGPGPWPGNAQVMARVYPYAIEQGKRGTIIVQTSAQSQGNTFYSLEILNSWQQLWKRIPVTNRPYEPYQILLPVGKTTKPGMLTYTVNLWLEAGFAGQRRLVGTTQFSFRVVTPGSYVGPYTPAYPGNPQFPMDPQFQGYPQSYGMPEYPNWVPYNAPTMGMPSSNYGATPSVDPAWSGMYPGMFLPYGSGYPETERAVE